jgi:hypothetical protein
MKAGNVDQAGSLLRGMFSRHKPPKLSMVSDVVGPQVILCFAQR